MEENIWKIQTHGDPIHTVREFITEVWRRLDLAGMILPLNGDPDKTGPAYTQNANDTSKLNPFLPLMPENALKVLSRTSPATPLGMVLRPCEVHSWRNMKDQGYAKAINSVSIGVDCLGTISPNDFAWRAERKGSCEALTKEILKFARSASVLNYRFRSSCQMCLTPESNQADINIWVIGLPVRQHILVYIPSAELAQRIDIKTIADGKAPPELIDQHKRIVAYSEARNERVRARIIATMATKIPLELDQFVDQLNTCEACQSCMEACPICDLHKPVKTPDGKYVPEDIARWLIACSGCGICEDNCPGQIPLTTIFHAIREELNQAASMSL